MNALIDQLAALRLHGMAACAQDLLSPKVTVGRPTLEGLHKHFIAGQSSLGLFSDEAGEFLGGYSMNSDNMMKTVSGFSKLWDGDGVDRVRAGDGSIFLPSVRLATHLMGTPSAIAELLADSVANGQGFLARFLTTEPPSNIGYRLEIDHAPESAATISAMSRHLQTILLTPAPTVDGNPQELEPRQLPLSTEARAALRGYYEQVETAQRPGCEFEGVPGFASKSPEQACRIAGVLTLWADLTAPEVTADTMVGAITLAQYYLGEAKRLCDAAEISTDTSLAEKLRLWLLNIWPAIAERQGRDPNTIVPRDVVQFGPNAIRAPEAVKKHLKTLEAHGWVVQLDSGTEVGGMARKLAYRIVRA